jgi:hypothetical protein
LKNVIMTGKSLSLSGIVLILACQMWAQSAKEDTEYRARGDRSEGTIQPRKSGNAIELMSATVDYQEPSSAMPASLAIRFYLKDRSPVSVSVRGVRVAEDYWMNDVHPKKDWEPGFANEFRWPTSEVIQTLMALEPIDSMYDLGVVVCLGASCQTTDDLILSVAPAIFYYSRIPTAIGGYRFTFKPITHESLTFNLYEDVNGDSKGASVWSQVYPDVEPGVPFNVLVSMPSNPGWYQLQVTGIKRFSKEEVRKTIRFYHAQAPTK